MSWGRTSAPSLRGVRGGGGAVFAESTEEHPLICRLHHEPPGFVLRDPWSCFQPGHVLGLVHFQISVSSSELRF